MSRGWAFVALALRGPFPVRLGLADQPMSAGSIQRRERRAAPATSSLRAGAHAPHPAGGVTRPFGFCSLRCPAPPCFERSHCLLGKIASASGSGMGRKPDKGARIAPPCRAHRKRSSTFPRTIRSPRIEPTSCTYGPASTAMARARWRREGLLIANLRLWECAAAARAGFAPQRHCGKAPPARAAGGRARNAPAPQAEAVCAVTLRQAARWGSLLIEGRSNPSLQVCRRGVPFALRRLSFLGPQDQAAFQTPPFASFDPKGFSLRADV